MRIHVLQSTAKSYLCARNLCGSPCAAPWLALLLSNDWLVSDAKQAAGYAFSGWEACRRAPCVCCMAWLLHLQGQDLTGLTNLPSANAPVARVRRRRRLPPAAVPGACSCCRDPNPALAVSLPSLSRAREAATALTKGAETGVHAAHGGASGGR